MIATGVASTASVPCVVGCGAVAVVVGCLVGVTDSDSVSPLNFFFSASGLGICPPAAAAAKSAID